MFGFTVNFLHSYYPFRIVLLIVGIVFLSFGVALYMNSDLGVAPYDMIGQIVEDLSHKKITFKWARIMLDCISVFIGFVTGGPFGLATFVSGFFTGPLVSWFRTKVVSKILEL